MQQMRQAEGMIMEQKREIAVMRSYMASEKAAAQESAIHANQTHREASKQISVYQQQISGIESSTSIEKFNKEEMVQSLKSQLEHALVKRPEMYSMEDTKEQLMTRLNDVTTFAEQESNVCFVRRKKSSNSMYPTCQEGSDDCYRGWPSSGCYLGIGPSQGSKARGTVHNGREVERSRVLEVDS